MYPKITEKMFFAIQLLYIKVHCIVNNDINQEPLLLFLLAKFQLREAFQKETLTVIHI